MATTRYDLGRMRDDMAQKGWRESDLARAAGLSRTTVNKVVRGLRANPATMKRLAEALGYSVRRYLISSRRAA